MHLGMPSLDLVMHLGARRAPQRSQLFAYGTHQRSRPFANGKNRGVFSLGLKPFVNGSCTQTGGNSVLLNITDTDLFSFFPGVCVQRN